MPRKSKSSTKDPSNETLSATSEPPAPSQETASGPSKSEHSFVEQVGPREPQQSFVEQVVPSEPPQTFVEQVGQKRGITVPDPFSIAGDYLAGVRLFESKRDRQMAIKFGEGRPEDKPSHEVIGKLKDAGYHWNPTDKIWAHAVWPASAMSTRIKAEILFQDICQTIRKEKGIDPGQEIPF
jgi:hypothetical protein